jgi:hypothetical protein
LKPNRRRLLFYSAASPLGDPARGEARRRGIFRLDAALEGARGEFFRPIRHPLRPWLLASGALTD